MMQELKCLLDFTQEFYQIITIYDHFVFNYLKSVLTMFIW